MLQSVQLQYVEPGSSPFVIFIRTLYFETVICTFQIIFSFLHELK